MWWPSSMYFSTSMRPSPKLLMASAVDLSKPLRASSASACRAGQGKTGHQRPTTGACPSENHSKHRSIGGVSNTTVEVARGRMQVGKQHLAASLSRRDLLTRSAPPSAGGWTVRHSPPTRAVYQRFTCTRTTGLWCQRCTRPRKRTAGMASDKPQVRPT